MYKILTFNLPNFQGRYLKQGTVGTYGSESLPNIKGITGYYASYPSGVFYTGAAQTAGGVTGTFGTGVGFDASRSSSTYKNNAKVNPDNAEILYVIKF